MDCTLLVTGGAGYIGVHVLAALVEAGYQPIVLDDLSNGDRRAVERVARFTGADIPFIEGDVRNERLLDAVLAHQARAEQPVAGVIHLAGRKAVGESVADPLRYYDVNVGGTVKLLRAMARHGVRRFVFSSSATVYGAAREMPVTERHAVCPTNPYGHTKLVAEGVLRDVTAADPGLSVAVLRYFNPIGAHPSGLIGECPQDVPANVFPYITQVAQGRRSHLAIFGDDYDTPDGTGVRDYLHVMDLAEGHVRAMQHVLRHPGLLTVNLGTGNGISVLALVRAFERVSGRRVPYRIAPRRPGDVAAIWADAGMAHRVLGWRATRTLEDMCADGWRWQRMNPQGYATPPEPVPSGIAARAVRGRRTVTSLVPLLGGHNEVGRV